MSPKKKEKFKELTEEFIRLYEQALKKEKENIEAKIRNKAQRPMYFVRITERCHETIYTGFRRGARFGWLASKGFFYNKIPKIRKTKRRRIK